MKKFILLTTALLSSISAYAVCTPPTTLKCNCAHPIIENGVLACGASYCGDKKCMPDGSCCESEKYCEVGDNKYCCADGQTCDSTKGCIEEKDLETLCKNANGSIIETNGRKFCRSGEMDWTTGKNWCETNGMTMPTLDELCPSSNGDYCPEMDRNIEFCTGESWTATLGGKGAYWVSVCGAIGSDPIGYAFADTICW